MLPIDQDWIWRISLLILLVIVSVGCAREPNSVASAIQVELIAKQSSIQVSNGGDSDTELQEDSATNIQINDQISSGENGLGLLQFQDSIDVELFPNAAIQLNDVQQESGGSIFVRLGQIRGHTNIILNPQSIARVTLETELATITTLEDGTEFVVCHKPGVTTCVAVHEGSVEFTSEGTKRTYKAGDSSFVAPGETPPPPVCMRDEEFVEWLANIQTGQLDKTLGQLVGEWSQDPCPETAQASPTVEVPTLPASTGMVKIEAGAYQIGDLQVDEFHEAQIDIELDEYWIDAYEVTNIKYAQFIEAIDFPSPSIWPGQDDHPVRGVTWASAAAYCDWANKRLPSEAEWEAAARGPGQNPPLHPWGDDPLAGGQVGDLPRDTTYPVGMFPFNQSPFGVFDLAGNVWEWVDDPYGSVEPGHQILRGGRFGLLKDMAYRQPTEPDNERFVPFAGFRCAAGQVQGE